MQFLQAMEAHLPQVSEMAGSFKDISKGDQELEKR
jgi:hypothetical protein